MDNYFSKNIKFLRQSKHLTQLQLGEKLNKDYSTIGKWENGTRFPTVEDTLKVAEFFEVDVAKLVNTDLFSQSSSNEFDILFDKYKGKLSEDDKEMIKFLLNKYKS